MASFVSLGPRKTKDHLDGGRSAEGSTDPSSNTQKHTFGGFKHTLINKAAGKKPGPWGKSRAPEPPPPPQQQQYHLTELDKADALMLRKSHETGFLSWFRNGLLATGIGVIAFVQSEVGREAGYAFFILGGVCVSFGGASYVGSLFALRRLMLLSVPAVLLNAAVVGSVALFWLCAVSLYIGRLEVEIIHENEEEGADEEGECRECRERREQRGYRASQDSDESGGRGQK
ncbi:transmembrane protein 160 [Kryptolebias marmoratus]|nr:transmembrane protein 160 [Kryptolebias marmoratus]